MAITKDPDALLKLAEKNPKAAEALLIDYFTANKVSGAYSRMKLAALKSFFTFNDVSLNWKKISSIIPPARKVAQDRAPSKDEVRRLLSVCDPRARMIVLCMASAGFRIGAWNWLNVGDIEFLDGGISQMTVYRGEPEQYHAFITPEATLAVQDYLDMRRRAGEDVRPDSPLVRDKWDFEDFRERVKGPKIVKRMKSQSIGSIIFRHWWRAGVRTKKMDRQDFKQAHGFRKFFKSNAPVCKEHGQLDAEVLMGHYLNYYKPSEEHLLEYYKSAVPSLSIDEKFRLKEEMETKDKQHQEGVKDLKLDYLTLKDELSEERKARERMERNLRMIMKHPGLAEKMKEHSKKS